jgi:hypothetical protein
VKVGDKVLLPEYGGTKVVLDDKVSQAKNFYFIYFFFNFGGGGGSRLGFSV